ncbi:hypothetical protein MPTK2_3g13320 [Marchantia polymorpha subsp. ruderalis]
MTNRRQLNRTRAGAKIAENRSRTKADNCLDTCALIPSIQGDWPYLCSLSFRFSLLFRSNCQLTSGTIEATSTSNHWALFAFSQKGGWTGLREGWEEISREEPSNSVSARQVARSKSVTP